MALYLKVLGIFQNSASGASALLLRSLGNELSVET